MPGIISRGYGRVDSGLSRKCGFATFLDARGGRAPLGGVLGALINVQPDTPADQCGDEPLLLRLRTGAPVMVGSDRVAAGQALLLQHPGVNVIVSDDGLQHRRLSRQAQVLVFDERGAGNGWLLPAGPLRERLPLSVPPSTVVLYNASTASTPLAGTLAQRSLAGAVSLADWWKGVAPSPLALHALRSRTVVAAAGLARPQRFFDMLSAAGLSINVLPLADHHAFQPLPWPAETDDVVVTEKDAVKLDPARMGRTRVWVAALDFSGGPSFDEALLALLPRPPIPTPENAHGSPTP